MGAHRSSLSQDSQVSSAAEELEILNGKGPSVVSVALYYSTNLIIQESSFD